MQLKIKLILKIVLSVCILYFSYLLLLITLQYLPFNLKVSFLDLKGKDIVNTIHYRIAFFTHVYTSIFLVIIGLIQFWNHKIIKNYHKHLGIAYVVIIIFLSAPSGFVMAFYANGGFWSKLSFVILTVLWIGFTYYGYSYRKKGQISHHKKMMYRSYALTLSAISLRLFKWGIVSAFELPPMDTYKFVAWAGWIVNLLIVEVFIYFFWRNNNKV